MYIIATMFRCVHHGVSMLVPSKQRRQSWDESSVESSFLRSVWHFSCNNSYLRKTSSTAVQLISAESRDTFTFVNHISFQNLQEIYMEIFIIFFFLVCLKHNYDPALHRNLCICLSSPLLLEMWSTHQRKSLFYQILKA